MADSKLLRKEIADLGIALVQAGEMHIRKTNDKNNAISSHNITYRRLLELTEEAGAAKLRAIRLELRLASVVHEYEKALIDEQAASAE